MKAVFALTLATGAVATTIKLASPLSPRLRVTAKCVEWGVCALGTAIRPSPPAAHPSHLPPPPPTRSQYSYGDPGAQGTNCKSNEQAVDFAAGGPDFCSPACSKKVACPTDFPPGTTATPDCAFSTTGGNPDLCALICDTT